MDGWLGAIKRWYGWGEEAKREEWSRWKRKKGVDGRKKMGLLVKGTMSCLEGLEGRYWNG